MTRTGDTITYGHGTQHTGKVLAVARSPRTGHMFALVQTDRDLWPNHTVDLETRYVKCEHSENQSPWEWVEWIENGRERHR